MAGEDSRRTFVEHRGARVRPSGPVADLAPGTRVDEYVVEAVLGTGGFGAVYRGRDADGRAVAIKVMHAAHALLPGAVERFQREVVAVRAVRHANLVSIHGVGRLPDRRPYLVMELLEGTDLDQILRRGRLPLEQVLAILEPLCEALAAAHAQGIVHRDVKASNVFIVDDERRVVLLDFGVAKMLDEPGEALTRPGQLLGTPLCMAPEQIAGGSVDARTDVYGLGVLLHVMLTGRPPFDAETPTQVLFLQRCAMPPRPSEHAPVPAAVDRLVAAALALDPSRRPAGARELAAELRRALAPVAPVHRVARALVVHVEARVAGAADADDRLDDRLIDDVDAVLARSGACLSERGFRIALETADAVLLARVLTEGEDEAAARVAAQAALRALEAELAARAHACAEVAVVLELDLGDVELDDDGQVQGGALLDLARWTPATR